MLNLTPGSAPGPGRWARHQNYSLAPEQRYPWPDRKLAPAAALHLLASASSAPPYQRDAYRSHYGEPRSALIRFASSSPAVTLLAQMAMNMRSRRATASRIRQRCGSQQRVRYSRCSAPAQAPDAPELLGRLAVDPTRPGSLRGHAKGERSSVSRASGATPRAPTRCPDESGGITPECAHPQDGRGRRHLEARRRPRLRSRTCGSLSLRRFQLA